jgi:hypothetical protein
VQFTNSEVNFLSQGSNVRGRAVAEITYDMKASMPPHIFNRTLESRAKKLGPEFTEFRDEQRRLATPNAPYQPPAQPDLDARIAGSRLF